MLVLRRLDRRKVLAFNTLSSEIAKNHGFEEGTVAVVQGEEVYLRSDAVRVALQAIGGISSLGVLVLKLTPFPIRDRVYRWVAKNRYRWFGKAGEASGDT